MSRIAVAIATLGRPETVSESLQVLRAQSRAADKILFSVTSDDDLPKTDSFEDIEIVMGSKGLCAQRNRALAKLLDDYDYIVFFDDDFVPSKYALERMVSFFEENPTVVGVTGNVLSDGIKTSGIPFEDACKIVESYDQNPAPKDITMDDVHGLYGCNMAFRVSAIGETRFDESLLYYGWLEDTDFSNQLLKQGRLVRTNAFAGVHCGVKSARSPGLRLGYSQIANPIYLGRKGTIPWAHAFKLMTRNIIANHVLSLKPEPWVDRFGRVRGNWLAFAHFATGKLSPTHIRDL
ncbi:MAG: glycosyltransferase [Henriciella sp.]